MFELGDWQGRPGSGVPPGMTRVAILFIAGILDAIGMGT